MEESSIPLLDTRDHFVCAPLSKVCFHIGKNVAGTTEHKESLFLTSLVSCSQHQHYHIVYLFVYVFPCLNHNMLRGKTIHRSPVYFS